MEGEPETEGWRVKLYELETQGAWIDKGTGYVICDYLPELSSPGLQIIGEESLESLLQCKIQATDTYERQGENIIMWRELDASGYVDYAMSFQESEGCLCIWDAIGKVQAQFLHQMGEGGPNGSLHEYVDAAGYHYAMVDPQDGQGGPFTPVLPVNCSNDDDLNQIKQKLDSLTVSTKDYVVSQLIHQDGEYIQRLFAKFTEMEERSFLPGLNTMADIFRSIFLLNDASLIGYLLCSDEIFVQVAGIFEYDKSLKSPPAYRHFLFTQAKLKEVVPFDGYFENPEELRSICVTVFRLKYVRDVMLHPTIDDPGVTALSSMIVFNSNEICSQMFHHILYVAKILEAIVPSSPKPVPETQTNPNPIPNTQISPNPHPEPQKTPNSPHSTEPLEGSVGGKGEEGVIKGEKERVKAGMRLDAVRLLKELFSLSRMLLVEKRNEIYELFFSHLRNQFVSVTTKLLSSNKHLNSEGVSTQPNTFWSKTIKTDRKKPKSSLLVRSDSSNIEKTGESPSPSTPSLTMQEKPNSSVVDAHSRQEVPLETDVSVSSVGSEWTVTSTVDNSGVQNPIDTETDSCYTHVSSEPPTTILDNLDNFENTDNPPSELEHDVLTTESDRLKVKGEIGVLEMNNEDYQVAVHCISEVLLSIVLTSPSLLRLTMLECPLPSEDSATIDISTKKNGDDVVKQLSHLLSGENERPNNNTSPLGSRWWTHNLLFLVIDEIVNGSDTASIQQMGDVLKVLLDFDKAYNSEKNEKERFLTLFYDHFINWLLAPFLEENNPLTAVPDSFYHSRGLYEYHSGRSAGFSGRVQASSAIVTSRRVIFEVLVYCVQLHSYRFKYFAMRNHVISKLLVKSLEAEGESWLHLSAVKFLRVVVAVRDEFYYRHIEKQDLLKPVFSMLKKISHKDNAVTSSVYELLEFLRLENVKCLIKQIVEKYADSLKNINHVKVLGELKIRYDQLMDNSLSRSSTEEDPKTKSFITGVGAFPASQQNRRIQDFEAEENYFFGDDDDDDADALSLQYTTGRATPAPQSDQEIGPQPLSRGEGQEEEGAKRFLVGRKRKSGGKQEFEEAANGGFSPERAGLSPENKKFKFSFEKKENNAATAKSLLSMLAEYGEDGDTEEIKENKESNETYTTMPRTPVVRGHGEVLVTDIYDEGDLDQKDRVLEPTHKDNGAVKQEDTGKNLSMGFGTVEEEESWEERLPPLKPKDEDDDITAAVFLQKSTKNDKNHKSDKLSTNNSINTDNIEKSIKIENDNDKNDNLSSNSQKSTPLVSFSLKKKQKLL